MAKNVTQEEWDKLPASIRGTLALLGARPEKLRAMGAAGAPYTQAGAPGLKGEYVGPAVLPGVSGATVRGQGAPDIGAAHESAVVYDEQDPTLGITRAHEMEHVLANQGLGSSAALNTKWDELIGKGDASRAEIAKRLVAAGPYLQKKWGLDAPSAKAGYFSPLLLRQKDPHNYVNEQLATLSALEQLTNKRLVDDPYMRANVFKTPGERETYDAVTGLRQTRMDPRDLPPYTRQPENPGGIATLLPTSLQQLFGK